METGLRLPFQERSLEYKKNNKKTKLENHEDIEILRFLKWVKNSND